MKVLEYLGARVAGILFLCWLCESAAGGCSRYGHACWGGHGKRSSQAAISPNQPLEPLELIQERDQDADDSGDVDSSVVNVGGGGGYLAEVAAQDQDSIQGGERFELGRITTKRIANLLPRVHGGPQDSNEIVNPIRNARRPNENGHDVNDDDDVQVFLIPDNAVSQSQKLPSLHIYKILGRTPRKHP